MVSSTRCTRRFSGSRRRDAHLLSGGHERADHAGARIGLARAGRPLDRKHRVIQLRCNALGEINSQFYGAFDDPFLGTAEQLSRDPTTIICYSKLGRYSPWSPGENMFSRRPPQK